MIRDRQLRDRLYRTPAGIVDQDVQLSLHLLIDERKDLLDRLLLCQIPDHIADPFTDRCTLLQRLLVPSDDDDASALLRKALADRAADTGTAADNDRNLVRSFCHLFHSSSSSQRCARRLDVRTGRCCLGNSGALLLLLHCKFSCEESEVCVRYPL